MSNNCIICDNKPNQTTRKLVVCAFCSFEACRICCETYILNESVPKCMSNSCGREWTRLFISTNFTNVFINTKLKKHREQLLFEQEKALLPATQPIVENMIKQDEIRGRVRELDDEIHQMYIRRRELEADIRNLDRNRNAPAPRAEFVRACPDSDCRGFLSTQWKCGICQKWACPECHEVKGLTRDVEHTCNPDNVATARLLANDTKPCPNCRTGIFKIDGCDQMWCTQCHTAFNWRTGRIEQVVHNPHYFEWLRRNGSEVPRNPGDIPCGGHHHLTHRVYEDIRTTLLTKYHNHWLCKPSSDMTGSIIRNIIHMRFVELDPQQTQQRTYVQKNQQLRIDYLRKVIDENVFKTKLQQCEKSNLKNTEINNIYTLLINTVSDIILRFGEHLHLHDTLDTSILYEIDPIVEYANECFADISKTYNCRLIKYSNTLNKLRTRK